MTAPRAARLIHLLVAGIAACAAALSFAQSPAASDPAPAADSASQESFDIAVVLPLDAPAYARAADAVRAGVLGAAGAGRSRVRVFAHGEDGVLAAFEAAQSAGAKVIIGPLVRDDLKVLAAMALELPWTIALNQFDE